MQESILGKGLDLNPTRLLVHLMIYLIIKYTHIHKTVIGLGVWVIGNKNHGPSYSETLF